MFKLLFLVLIVVIGVVLAPHIGVALYWTMAFLSLLMAGDLLRSEVRKLRGRRRRQGSQSWKAVAPPSGSDEAGEQAHPQHECGVGDEPLPDGGREKTCGYATAGI
jgi:hypothetical protein